MPEHHSTNPPLVVFDMDGTLLPDATACHYIGEASNTTDIVQDLEERYGRGEIQEREFAQILARTWKQCGANYRSAFDRSSKIDGIDTALNELRCRGITTCLVTMAPYEFACNFSNFDFVYGSTYPDQVLTPDDKPIIVEKLERSLHKEPRSAVVIGDSYSDIPLFGSYPSSIALNATRELQALAARTVNTRDLVDVLPHITSMS